MHDATEAQVSWTAAAIDIGSNTLKMTIARVSDGDIEDIARYTDTVRLGRDLDRTGRLADDRIEAAVVALRRFAELARDAGAETIVAVGTEALRVAANGPDTLSRIEEETGIRVEIISGDREADLTFAGVMANLHIEGDLVLADIGGASTELIVAVDGRRIFSKSVPLGSGRMTDRYVVADPPAHAELTEVQSATRDIVRGAGMPPAPDCTLVVVGGTGEFLLALAPSGEPAIAPAEMASVRDELTTIGSTDLAPRLSIAEARARVLPAGAAIVLGLCDEIAPTVIMAASSGIRRGLLMELAAGQRPLAPSA